MKSPYFMAGIATIIGATAVVEHFNINTVRYQVCSDKIPKSFNHLVILQLSDMHGTEHGCRSCRLIEKIDEISPDIILMTGDMVSRHSDLSIFTSLCRNLGRRYNTFYTLGNHELDLPDEKLIRLINSVKNSGVHFLNNEKSRLISGESSIDIYGMWANLSYYKDEKFGYRRAKPFEYNEMHRLIGIPKPDRFNILMAHNPQWMDIYTKWGANLVFSGHNHGGAIRIPFVGGLLSPERKFFPKYDLGLFSKERTAMIVSGGIGGVRLFNRPQIVVTELISKQK